MKKISLILLVISMVLTLSVQTFSAVLSKCYYKYDDRGVSIRVDCYLGDTDELIYTVFYNRGVLESMCLRYDNGQCTEKIFWKYYDSKYSNGTHSIKRLRDNIWWEYERLESKDELLRVDTTYYYLEDADPSTPEFDEEGTIDFYYFEGYDLSLSGDGSTDPKRVKDFEEATVTLTGRGSRESSFNISFNISEINRKAVQELYKLGCEKVSTNAQANFCKSKKRYRGVVIDMDNNDNIHINRETQVIFGQTVNTLGVDGITNAVRTIIRNDEKLLDGGGVHDKFNYTLDTDLLGKDVNNLPVTDPGYAISRKR